MDNSLDSIQYQRLDNSYGDLLVIDSSGIYRVIKPHKAIMLRQNPKIHLGDMIDNLKPEIIITDAAITLHLWRVGKQLAKLKIQHFTVLQLNVAIP